jgi:hypothetical protein
VGPGIVLPGRWSQIAAPLSALGSLVRGWYFTPLRVLPGRWSSSFLLSSVFPAFFFPIAEKVRN